MDTTTALRRDMQLDFVRRGFEDAFGVEFQRQPFSRWLWSLAQGDLDQSFPREVLIETHLSAFVSPVLEEACEVALIKPVKTIEAAVVKSDIVEVELPFFGTPVVMREAARPVPVEVSASCPDEQRARAYIVEQMEAHKPVSPHYLFELTGWEQSKIRQFVTQVQDEARPARKSGSGPGVGIGALIAAIHEVDDEDDVEPPAAALDAIEQRPARSAKDAGNTKKPVSPSLMKGGLLNGRFVDKTEVMCFTKASNKAEASGETLDEELWKADFRARRAAKAQG